MPAQSDWNDYTASERMLYLVNSERCARGLLPFEGIDPRMVNSAQEWVTYHEDNRFNTYLFQPTHGAGNQDIPSRFSNAGVDTGSGGNADFMVYSENIATYWGALTPDTMKIKHPEVLAVFGWMYTDKTPAQGSAYGHRKFMLVKELTNNYGSLNGEGLFGAASANRKETISQGGNTFDTDAIVSVMHAFDPSASYVPRTGETITPAPDMLGPTAATDCQAGSSFTAGSNGQFGTCQ